MTFPRKFKKTVDVTTNSGVELIVMMTMFWGILGLFVPQARILKLAASPASRAATWSFFSLLMATNWKTYDPAPAEAEVVVEEEPAAEDGAAPA